MTAKAARLEIRISDELAALLKRAAEIKGLTKSAFAADTLQREAEHVVREHEVLELSLTDQMVFAEALINPPEPNDALIAAVVRHKELTGES